MVAIPERQYLTPQVYLDWEEKQEIKYEYIDGWVWVIFYSYASITREDAKGYYLQEGDLLFARSGATVGKVI